MHLKNWLSLERGRATALADRLGLTQGRITQMADDGVPAKYMLAVREFTEGEVSLEDMLYGRAPVCGKPLEA